eukprot:TRINITY_DN3742_c0_g1_i2.p1 TRINITY_DN3742_c0_g1~~TRINITY_DN3742_c0_g1_i2.p1  ORF type:complete len:350 (+),score=70.17 TRINITY_DN3742_c0_g1_i2:257-1306(+)
MKSLEDGNNSKGGLLCEKMGLGKTLICLSLISLGIGNTSSHKKGEVFTEKRNKVETKKEGKELVLKNNLKEKVPTLKYLAMTCIKKNSVNYKKYKAVIPKEVYVELDNICSFFFHQKKTKSHRKSQLEQTKIYLSHTTLIVVPQNLIHQWQSEIYKHLNDNSLEVYIDNFKGNLPDASLLCKYDIILTSHSRFSKIQEKLIVPNFVRFGQEGNKTPPSNPLTRIKFVRLIVDEGKILGNVLSSASYSLNSIKSNNRWVVSGTPTNINSSLLDSLKTLYGLISFLKYKPFSDKKYFSKTIQNPIVKKDCPEAENALKKVLSKIVIKHKHSDIDLVMGVTIIKHVIMEMRN